jgi:hypothetical protein
MAAQLRVLLLGCLPVLVFVPLLIGSRLVAGRAVPPWVDWALLLGCAALVAFNPMLQRFESIWTRGALFTVAFAVWGVLLFFLTFWIMRVVFSESL